jgi:hypothetical protein
MVMLQEYIKVEKRLKIMPPNSTSNDFHDSNEMKFVSENGMKLPC